MGKQMRGAAAYKEKARARIKTQEVELPSGAIFLLRKPDLEKFAISGALPSSIAGKMEQAAKQGKSSEDAFLDLSPAEKEKSFQFGRTLIFYICVEPRVVENPQSDDELTIEDLDSEDLKFLLEWARSGGGEAASLDNFRPESNSMAGSGGAKQRTAGKQLIKD